MYHKSILGTLNQQIKSNPPKLKRVKETPSKPLPKNEQKMAEIPMSNFSKLISNLGLEQEAKEIKQDEDNNHQFQEWVKDLQTQKINISSVDLEAKLDDYFSIDTEKFIEDNLEEILEEQINENEIDEIDKMGNDLNSSYKQIAKQMLNDITFKKYTYKNLSKTTKYQTDQFVLDYSSRTENSLKLTKKVKNIKKNDIQKILGQHVDLSILDFDQMNYEEYVGYIIEYLYNYSNLMNQKIEKNNLKEEKEKISGFVKPRVLLIVTFKKEAHDLLMQLISTSNTKMKDSLQEKFDEEFNSEETAFDDKFVIGVFLKEEKIHLTTNLNFAEIIITTTAWISTNMENHSLLSSIEVLYLHKINDIYMQNQENLTVCFEKMNKMPEHKYCTEDFGTIREVFIQNIGCFHRQNISYGDFATVQLTSFMNRHFSNKNGSVKFRQFFPKFFNEINFPKPRFIFRKVEVISLKDEFEEKLNFFKSQVWDKERENEKLTQSLIIVNDYLHYKELKSYFEIKHSPVGFISEHTPKSKIQGVYARFNEGVHKYILTTERAIYYQVALPKKYQNIILFGFPYFFKVFEQIFEEISENDESEVHVIFSKKDAYELEKLLGTTKTREFLAQKNKFKILELN